MGWDMMGPSRARVSTPGRVRKDNVRFCKVSMISAAIFFIFSPVAPKFLFKLHFNLGFYSVCMHNMSKVLLHAKYVCGNSASL